MPAESKSLSEFPRALEVLSGALLLISNPSGQDSFDTNSALLTEVAQAMLDVHYTQELGDVSVFDAIKNCRVLSGTTTPTSAEGVDGQLYIKYETTGGVDEVVAMYFKKSSAWLEISLGGGGNTDYIECTQAQYDAWEQGGTLDPTVMYFITDGRSGGSSTLAGLSDVNLTNPTDGQLLRYNGTSGKWENAGIINDTTASASSVYSSSKTNHLLSGKADKTDFNTTNFMVTRYNSGDTGVPSPLNGKKSGKVCMLNIANIIKSGSYSNLWLVPQGYRPTQQFHYIISLGSSYTIITILTDGTIKFNTSPQTLNSDVYMIGCISWLLP